MKNRCPKRICVMILLMVCVFSCFIPTVYATPILTRYNNEELIDREDAVQTVPTQDNNKELDNSEDTAQKEPTNFWDNINQPVPNFFDWTTSKTYIDRMSDIAMFWYRFIRNYIAVPLMILSFSTCGYRFFMCAFMGKPEYAIDTVKKQFINTVITMFVLFMLPVVMTIVRDLTESTKWTPPS